MNMHQSKAAAVAAMEVTTQLIQHHIRNTMEYLRPILGMANAPMVTYLTENLWKTHIPMEIQDEIRTTADIQTAVDIFWNHLKTDQSDCATTDQLKHFRTFLRRNTEFYLDNLRGVWITPEQLKCAFDTQRANPLPIHGFMSTKKNHEVKQVVCASFISTFYQKNYFLIQFAEFFSGLCNSGCDCEYVCANKSPEIVECN